MALFPHSSVPSVWRRRFLGARDTSARYLSPELAGSKEHGVKNRPWEVETRGGRRAVCLRLQGGVGSKFMRVRNPMLVIVEVAVGIPVSGLSWVFSWISSWGCPGWRMRLNGMERSACFYSLVSVRRTPGVECEHTLALCNNLFKYWAGQGNW